MDEGNRRPAERVRRSPAAPGKRRRAVPQSHHTAVEEPSPIFCCAMDGSGICMLGTDRRPAPVGLARAAAVRSDRQEGCPLTLALPAPQGEGTIQVPQRLVIPNCGDDWTSTPPHPSPLPASGAREQLKCGSALLPPRPMQWGEVGVRGIVLKGLSCRRSMPVRYPTGRPAFLAILGCWVLDGRLPWGPVWWDGCKHFSQASLAFW